MYSVTVLTPKGRRQQVKITPNTTLLQILEEVCMKHGFKPSEYDLKHHNKVLDISSMFQFSSLPNNAQLEMAETTRLRKESPVTLGLQFESGERLTGEFDPSDSIWNAIVTLKPEENNSDNLVAVYMRQEIIGRDSLKKTTLRSLGLTGGRAMLRVLHKSPEELRTQANVSSILPRQSAPSPAVAVPTKKSPESKRIEKPVEKTETEAEKKPKTPSPEIAKKETKPANFSKDQNLTRRDNVLQKLLMEERAKRLSESSGAKNIPKDSSTKDNLAHKSGIESKGIQEKKEEVLQTKKASEKEKTRIIEKELKPESKAIFLGERNAVAYNMNSVKPVVFEEEPEGFFDLTVNDAKMLYAQAKQLCADLEEAPLMTAAQRELEKDKRVLSLLNQYKKTVLRIKFPDRTVLQGTFSPIETVADVEKFVGDYLESPKIKFYLYTTPPKVILKSEERLIECGCVPSCVVYFGLSSDSNPPSQYLRSEVLQKLSTPSAAAFTALEVRKTDKRLPQDVEEGEKRKWCNQGKNSEAGPSGIPQWESKPRDQERSPQFKVPKWFKTNK